MIIECPHCEARVDGEIIGEHESYDHECGMPFKAVLLILLSNFIFVL